MLKKILYLTCLITSLFSIACQFGKQEALTKEFANKYASIQKTYSDKIAKTINENEKSTLSESRSKELETLLNFYDPKTTTDEAELLKSKLLVELSRFKDANKKVDALLIKKSPLMVEAQLIRVRILLHNGETDKALDLFKQIEPGIKKGRDLYSIWLSIALYTPDTAIFKNYAGKFLGVTDLPSEMKAYKGDIYRKSSRIAREEQNKPEALTMLQNAIASSPKEGLKQILEWELKQTELLTKPAPLIYADSWLNSPPLYLENMKGKPVVLVFWSTWSSFCKEIMTILSQQYESKKSIGLTVIGYTKLYGKYKNSDTPIILPPSEEMASIQNYITSNNVTFPIAISTEGYGFEDYQTTILPTLFFIDKNGNVWDFITGTSDTQTINKKIQKLLEVPYGKNKIE